MGGGLSLGFSYPVKVSSLWSLRAGVGLSGCASIVVRVGALPGGIKQASGHTLKGREPCQEICIATQDLPSSLNLLLPLQLERWVEYKAGQGPGSLLGYWPPTLKGWVTRVPFLYLSQSSSSRGVSGLGV